jgi:4-amino-4-deoxy-L-arabinose transferase-like glycosyltransferase
MSLIESELRGSPPRPEPPRTYVRAPRGAWLAILVAACVLQAAWVAGHVLAAKSAFSWDPSHHSMWGWLVWSDLTTGNWLSFLYDTYRQVYWPPLHSWMLAAAMLAFGPSVFTTGLVSLAAYSATGVLLGVLAARAERRHRVTAGAVAAGLWLTSGNLVNRYATEAYTEMPAVAVTAGALLLLARALERDTRAAWALAGAAAMVTYLTKTDYGLVLMMATVAGTLLAVRARSRPEPLRGLLPWALAVAVLAALWFAYPPKIPVTIAALVNREQGPPLLSVAGVGYHFAKLVQWTDGFVVWGLCLAAFGAAALRPRTDLVRIVVAYVAIALLLHTLSQTKDVKHVVKVVPWLFLLAGVQAARLRAVAETSRRRNAAVWLLALALGAGAYARAADFVRTTRQPQPAHAAALVEAVAARIQPQRSHVVLGAFGALSPHALTWTRVGDDPRARVVPDGMTKTGYTREAFQERMADLRRRVPALGFVEPGLDGPVYRVAYLMPRRSRDEVTDAPAILDRMGVAGADRILVVALEPGSTWDTEDYRDFIHPGAAFVPHLRARPDLELAEVVGLPEHGVRVFVFDRVAAPAGRDLSSGRRHGGRRGIARARPARQRVGNGDHPPLGSAVRHGEPAFRHPAAAVRHARVHSVPTSG